ncbi:MAG: CHC2 zinc finger domain-containing protein [Anaerotignum sp.]|nr:CHC2 zinc finger domain-containing protein [Anaerotignum sp.]
MTKDEIKATYSMRDIVERYGFHPNRAGFISCPFHTGDRSPSLKVYSRDFHCHACGADGDIFDFVQKMDNLSFKEAFQSLGGEYQKPSFKSNLAIYRARKKRDAQVKQARTEEENRQLNNSLISIYRRYMERFEPLSDGWCDCYNRLQMEIYRHKIINEMR